MSPNRLDMRADSYTEVLGKNHMGGDILKNRGNTMNFGRPPLMPNYGSLENDISMLKKSIL